MITNQLINVEELKSKAIHQSSKTFYRKLFFERQLILPLSIAEHQWRSFELGGISASDYGRAKSFKAVA